MRFSGILSIGRSGEEHVLDVLEGSECCALLQGKTDFVVLGRCSHMLMRRDSGK